MKIDDNDVYILISYDDFEEDLKYFCIPKSDTELYNRYKGVYGFVNSCKLTDENIEESIMNMYYALYNRENPNNTQEQYHTELSKKLDKYIVEDLNNLNVHVESIYQVGWLP